jgi:hypothetical protein
MKYLLGQHPAGLNLQLATFISGKDQKLNFISERREEK